MLFFYGGVVLQVICGIHAVKNGRYNWLWIILFFSFVGCLIYFFVEILPDLTSSTTHMTTEMAKTINPSGEIKRLRAEFDLCESIENRQELAAVHIRSGQYTEGIRLLEAGMTAALQDDPYFLSQLAHAYYLDKNYSRTCELFQRIKDYYGRFEKQEWHLLYAMALNKVGDIESARLEYDSLIKYYAGEEARCRYALLLKTLGEDGKAEELFKKIIQKCKISPGFYRKEHAKWLKLSLNELAYNKK
ncbi:MAG: hypothetical protein K8S27_07075 [Candidatus Omnitrophica bacterium]|nr:hypothetical protein [Candidatus Omnitrophota bacterium]